MPHRGSHDRLDHLDPLLAPPPTPGRSGQGGSASGAGTRRPATLAFAVEVARQATRPRTRWTLGLLAALPLVVAIAFTFGSGTRGRGAPGLVDLASSGAANFTLFTLFASTGFFLVVVIALFAGDTVASEASWSSLRYLLTIPVDRRRLLWSKWLVALAYSALALVVLPVISFVIGGLFYGWAPARTPLGTTLPNGTFALRLVVCVAYLGIVMLVVAALAFALGVWTDAPLGAVGGAVLLVIVSNILDSITALGSWREVLPTHYTYAWLDALNPDIAWAQMVRGGLWSLTYTLLLLAAAWWHFLRKDVVS